MAAQKKTGSTSQKSDFEEESEFETITPAGAVDVGDDEELDTSSFDVATPDDDMQRLGRKQFYKPEVCKEAPIKGKLVREVLLNPKTVGMIDEQGIKEQPNLAYEIDLEHPTWAYCTKDDKPIRYQAKKGSRLYVPAKWELNEFHEKLRGLPGRVFTVYAKPLKKIPHPKDRKKSIWRWDVRIGKSYDRKEIMPETMNEPLLGMPEAGMTTVVMANPSTQLPQGGTTFNYGANASQTVSRQ